VVKSSLGTMLANKVNRQAKGFNCFATQSLPRSAAAPAMGLHE
jgi:hypothetical protein